MSSFVNLLDIIYPVGSIYYAYGTATSPASTVGGTWSRIKDAFLWFTSDDAALGKTGGEEAHTLTIDEMPAHSHKATTKGSIGGSTQLNKYTDQWGASSLDSSVNLDVRVTWSTGGANPTTTCRPTSSVLRGTVLPNFQGGDVACHHLSTSWTSFIRSVRSISQQTLHHLQALSEELGRRLRLTLSSVRERLCQQVGQTLKRFQRMKSPAPFGKLVTKEHIRQLFARALIPVLSLPFKPLRIGRATASTFVQNILLSVFGTGCRNLALGGVASV